MAPQPTRRHVLLAAAATALASCTHHHSETPQAAGTPIGDDPCDSDAWTSDLVEQTTPAHWKVAAWHKAAAVDSIEEDGDDATCTILPGMVATFYADVEGNAPGTLQGTFSMELNTHDPNGKFRLRQSFKVFDGAGKVLFTVGPYTGVEMPEPGAAYRWIEYFDFPKSAYAAMHKVCRSPATCMETAT
jgi:hypothetical protein